jgi:hypothetical protein
MQRLPEATAAEAGRGGGALSQRSSYCAPYFDAAYSGMCSALGASRSVDGLPKTHAGSKQKSLDAPRSAATVAAAPPKNAPAAIGALAAAEEATYTTAAGDTDDVCVELIDGSAFGDSVAVGVGVGVAETEVAVGHASCDSAVMSVGSGEGEGD